MKKLLFIIAVTFLFVLGISLNFNGQDIPSNKANAHKPESYEFQLSKEILLSHNFIGLENNPHRSINFKELENGNVQVAIEFDVSYSDAIVEEYAVIGEELPAPETFVYEISKIENEGDNMIHLISEDESIWIVFESDESGFIYDQTGNEYMVVSN